MPMNPQSAVMPVARINPPQVSIWRLRNPPTSAEFSYDSENVDGWKARHRPQAVPQIDGEANIARPKRVSAAAELLARLAALGCGRHGECPGAFKPNGVARSSMQLEECIAVAPGAVTEIGAFGQ